MWILEKIKMLSGDLQKAQQLYRAGNHEAIRSKNEYGETCMHLACQGGSVQVCFPWLTCRRVICKKIYINFFPIFTFIHISANTLYALLLEMLYLPFIIYHNRLLVGSMLLVLQKTSIPFRMMAIPACY